MIPENCFESTILSSNINYIILSIECIENKLPFLGLFLFFIFCLCWFCNEKVLFANWQNARIAKILSNVFSFCRSS